MIIHIISTNQRVKCANRQTFSCESCSLTFLYMKRHAIASLDNHFRTHNNHSRSHPNNCAFIKFITRKYIFSNITCFEFRGSVIILRLLRHLNTGQVGLHKRIPLCTFTSSYCDDVLFQCFEEQLGAVNSQATPRSLASLLLFMRSWTSGRGISALMAAFSALIACSTILRNGL